jgi:hypothetical protein
VHAWAAWSLALLALVLLTVASALLFLYAPWRTNVKVETGAFWLDALVLMAAPVLGLLITLRQPKNRYGWLWLVHSLSAAVIAIGAAIYYMHGAKPTGYPLPTALLLWAYVPATFLSILCYPLFALWFPTGQTPTPRWRFLEVWLAIDLLLFIPAAFTVGIFQNSTVAIDNPLGFVPLEITAVTVPLAWLSAVLASVLAALSVFFRYRRAGPVERQQIKWFLLGGAALASVFILPVTVLPDGLPSKIYNAAMLLVVYGTIGIAILRYRLFDIDVIIRKTLVWAVVTGALGLVYFGGVTLLQAVFSAISSQQSAISIVISTLLIAALFNPLRSRVQEFVDRRFYRRKYNAEQALASFAALARDEVDLEEISARLLQVVEETVQPESVSLWLKPTADRRQPTADG